MNRAPLEKLISQAQDSDDFGAFYISVAEAFGILRAEEAVSCEFVNLKSFCDWTRGQTISLQASPRNENKGSETSVMLHPETLRLSVKCIIH